MSSCPSIIHCYCFRYLDERKVGKIRLWLLVPTLPWRDDINGMGKAQALQTRIWSGGRQRSQRLRKVSKLLLLEPQRAHTNHRFGWGWNCSLGSQVPARSKGYPRICWMRCQRQCLQVLILKRRGLGLFNSWCFRFYLENGKWFAQKVIDVKPKKVSGWIGDYIQGNET